MTARRPIADTAQVTGLTEAMPLGFNRWSLRHFYDKAYAIETAAAAAQVTVAIMGDSVSGAKSIYLIPAMYQAYGYAGCGLGTAGSGIYGTTASMSGGSYELDNTSGKEYDYTYWPTGIHYVVPNTGTIQFGVGGGSFSGTRFTFYYFKRPGGGTATVDLLDTGLNVVQTADIDTDDAVGAGKVEFTEAAATSRWIRITGTSAATVLCIAPLFVNEDAYGIISLNMGRGGLSVDDANSSSATILNYVFGDVGIDIGFWESKEGGTQAQYDAMFAALAGRLKTATPHCDWVFFGTTPTSADAGYSLGEDSATQMQNAATKAACEAQDFLYYDTYTPLASYETLQDLDWEADGVHLAAAANRYTANLFAHDTGILDLLGAAEHRNISSPHVHSPIYTLSSNAYNRETTEKAEDAVTVVPYGSDNDVLVKQRRCVYFQNAAGTTTALWIKAAGDFAGVTILGSAIVSDADLATGHINLSIDTAGAKLHIKVKDANGVIKTADVALT